MFNKPDKEFAYCKINLNEEKYIGYRYIMVLPYPTPIIYANMNCADLIILLDDDRAKIIKNRGSIEDAIGFLRHNYSFVREVTIGI